MYRPPFLFGAVLFVTGVFVLRANADEPPFQQDKPAPSVSVLCHGRLRHGVVAVGGETTGTTITFQKITWELRLPDEASRKFAEQNHKKHVVVAGTLTKVTSTEGMTRWIINVTRLTEPDSDALPKDSALLNIGGTLHAALSQTGNAPELWVSALNYNWKLDFAASREQQAAAESLIGKPVLVSGSLSASAPEKDEGPTEERLPVYVVRVKTIKAANTLSATLRAFD